MGLETIILPGTHAASSRDFDDDVTPKVDGETRHAMVVSPLIGSRALAVSGPAWSSQNVRLAPLPEQVSSRALELHAMASGQRKPFAVLSSKLLSASPMSASSFAESRTIPPVSTSLVSSMDHNLGPVVSKRTQKPAVTEMYLSSAERLVLQSASCRLMLDRDGHEIAVVLNSKTPLMMTFISLHLMVCFGKSFFCW